MCRERADHAYDCNGTKSANLSHASTLPATMLLRPASRRWRTGVVTAKVDRVLFQCTNHGRACCGEARRTLPGAASVSRRQWTCQEVEHAERNVRNLPEVVRIILAFVDSCVMTDLVRD